MLSLSLELPHMLYWVSFLPIDSQVEKADIRSYKILTRACYLGEILQESDKKSSFLQTYIKSYCIFFKDLMHALGPLETHNSISRTYVVLWKYYNDIFHDNEILQESFNTT
jgi:hypothetical protein